MRRHLMRAKAQVQTLTCTSSVGKVLVHHVLTVTLPTAIGVAQTLQRLAFRSMRESSEIQMVVHVVSATLATAAHMVKNNAPVAQMNGAYTPRKADLGGNCGNGSCGAMYGVRRSTNKKRSKETHLASIAPSADEISTFGDMEAGDNGCAGELDHVHSAAAILLVATHMSL